MSNNVDRLHRTVRQMAADFVIRPETRINEGELAKTLGVSRTPLREALNRLVAEGFLTFRSGHGFSCRSLSPELIMHWYEARSAIEMEGARLSLQRASDADMAAVFADFEASEAEYLNSDDPIRLLELDEAFHSALLGLAGNPQLSSLLDTINGHIRYVRMMNLKNLRIDGNGRPDLDRDHRRIVELFIKRDEAALTMLRRHIDLRLEDARRAVEIAFAQIYMRKQA